VRVGALVRYAQRFSGLRDAEVQGLSKDLGLTSIASARAGELSKGEKRRLALFNALCCDRPVIVLDEPLGAFDPRQLLDILQVLRERAKTRALILSVHQLSDAEKIATRVLILDEGRLLADGSLSALRARVQRPEGSLEEVFLHILEQEHVGA
jgi:ABC-2 type transport system ATP-binding protein